MGGKSRPHQNSIPDRPARRQSLYRLSYRRLRVLFIIIKILTHNTVQGGVDRHCLRGTGRVCLRVAGGTEIYTNRIEEMAMQTVHRLNGMFVQQYDQLFIGNSHASRRQH